MNAGYGKNSPKVLNLTLEFEFHHEDTKTNYLQKRTKLTKVKFADGRDERFSLRPSLHSGEEIDDYL
jgi:hypothetical protein